MPAPEAAYAVLELHVALNFLAREALRISGTNNNPLPLLEIVANDKFLCRLRFYESVESVLNIRKLSSGVVKLNAVEYGAVTGDTVLFQCGDFTLTENGDDAYYEAVVNTETTQVNTLMGPSSEKLILFSVQVSNVLGTPATRRKTVAYQQARLLADGYDDAQIAAAVTFPVTPQSYIILTSGGGSLIQVSVLDSGQLRTTVI